MLLLRRYLPLQIFNHWKIYNLKQRVCLIKSLYVMKRTHLWPKSQLMTNLKSEGVKYLGTRNLKIEPTSKDFYKDQNQELFT